MGGLLSLFGALSFAELGAALPEAGGQYAYLRKGLGPVWGFLFGWMHSTVGESSSAASIAAGFARFSSFLIPAIAAPIFTSSYQPLLGQTLRICIYLGAAFGGRRDRAFHFHQLFGRAPGWARANYADDFEDWRGAGDRGRGILVWPRKHGTFPSVLAGEFAVIGTMTGFFAALAAALWAYDGWEDLNRVGSEMQNPQRNIPLALVGGTILVAGLYLLFSAVCFYALPFASVAAFVARGVGCGCQLRGTRRGGVDYVGDGDFGAGHAEFFDT